MKKIIMVVGLATLLASPAFGQAPSASYGTGNIIFPGDPSAAAAAGASAGTIFPGVAGGGAFAYEPAPPRTGSCAQRFKSYDARSGTYLGHDGRRHACR